MHSCSIIMAAGSHGSSFYGGVRLRPMTDLSSCNAMQASLWHEGRVQRDLSGQPRSLRWPSQNPLPRTSTLKHWQTPVPVHRPRRFCTNHLCVAPHCHAATHFASARSLHRVWSATITHGVWAARGRRRMHRCRSHARQRSIACAARLLQNRCIDTHPNKSAPRGGASERSNNRASAPRGGAVAFRTNQ